MKKVAGKAALKPEKTEDAKVCYCSTCVVRIIRFIIERTRRFVIAVFTRDHYERTWKKLVLFNDYLGLPVCLSISLFRSACLSVRIIIYVCLFVCPYHYLGLPVCLYHYLGLPVCLSISLFRSACLSVRIII